MQELVNECLKLIIKDNVDEVVQAFRNTYFWYALNNFPAQKNYQDILDRFLKRISQVLAQHEYKRLIISEREITSLPFRDSTTIANVIQKYIDTSIKHNGIDFLGELNGAYALTVPEPQFRLAKTYLGLHMTPNIRAIDDNLPMTDDMILYAWQYDWFYSWLGY